MTATLADISRSAALGWQLLQAGNLAAADDVVRPWLTHSGNDLLVPLIGAIRLQQGRFPEAAPMFERARALHPDQARFAFLHGTALAGLGQQEQAISAWQAATTRSGPEMRNIGADTTGTRSPVKGVVTDQSPIAAAALSAVCQRRRSAPGAQVEWVPLETRSGSLSLQTGPSATRAASKTRQYEASAVMSVVIVTR